MFYSQQQEDKILYEKYLDYTNGFFIELGAMDGRMYSNTLFFESQLNWKGVLIEPTEQFKKLIQNRPNCHNFNFAVSETEGEVEFLGSGALGGMLNTMPDCHRIGWKLDLQPKYKVKSMPISKIISNLDIDLVDLFSIDVEGGEIEVLKTFDWSIPVYLILIEGNYTMTDEEKLNYPQLNDIDWKKIDECREILEKNNFVFVDTIGCNQVWINEKNKRRL